MDKGILSCLVKFIDAKGYIILDFSDDYIIALNDNDKLHAIFFNKIPEKDEARDFIEYWVSENEDLISFDIEYCILFDYINYSIVEDNILIYYYNDYIKD